LQELHIKCLNGWGKTPSFLLTFPAAKAQEQSQTTEGCNAKLMTRCGRRP